MEGSEYCGKMSEKIQQYDIDTVIDYFVWGTPEQRYEKILDIHARTGNSRYAGVFRYAGNALRRQRTEHAALPA